MCYTQLDLMTLGSKAGCKPSRKSAHAPYKAYRNVLPSRLSSNHISSGGGSISGSSSSRHVHHSFSRTAGARLSTSREILTSSQIQTRTASDHIEYQDRINSMTATELSNMAALKSEVTQAEDDGPPAIDILDILSGRDSVDISHIGGEFSDLLALGDDLLGPSSWYVQVSFFSV